jgi:hypothetical protein
VTDPNLSETVATAEHPKIILPGTAEALGVNLDDPALD